MEHATELYAQMNHTYTSTLRYIITDVTPGRLFLLLEQCSLSMSYR